MTLIMVETRNAIATGRLYPCSQSVRDRAASNMIEKRRKLLSVVDGRTE